MYDVVNQLSRSYCPDNDQMSPSCQGDHSNPKLSTVRLKCDDNRDSWWRHQMETFSALLAICAGNSPIPGEFPAQRPVTRSFDVFFDLRLNKRLSKQSQIISLIIVYLTVYSGADQENIRALRCWPLWGEFTGDRWIPHTKGQLSGKCFHSMTSSWVISDLSKGER